MMTMEDLELGGVLISKDGLMRMAKDKKLTKDAHALLLHLIGILEHLNYFYSDLDQISETLEMTPLEIARSLKTLSDLRYITPKGLFGKADLYRMSPHIAWKGTMEDYDEEFGLEF
jgi:hypothetical protein